MSAWTRGPAAPTPPSASPCRKRRSAASAGSASSPACRSKPSCRPRRAPSSPTLSAPSATRSSVRSAINEQARPRAEQVFKDIRRATRRHFSAEDKIRIVLDGLRGEDSIAALCRREGIVQNLYYRWSKDFLEAGKNG